MRTGRPKEVLVLEGGEREQLEQWSRRRKTAQALAERSRIILGCADGTPDKEGGRQERGTRQIGGKGERRGGGRGEEDAAVRGLPVGELSLLPLSTTGRKIANLIS